MRRALSIGAEHCGVDHHRSTPISAPGPGHIYEERHCQKWKRLNLLLVLALLILSSPSATSSPWPQSFATSLAAA